MHVILVELEIKPEHLEAFMVEAARHAADTRENEPGCVQFDISTDKSSANVVYLYEVYADDDALEAHRRSPSLARYRETTGDWTVRRSVKTALKQD